MTYKHARETVETIDRSTFRERGPFLAFLKTVNNGESSMMSEPTRETVETIDRSTVCERGPFRKAIKIYKIKLIKGIR